MVPFELSHVSEVAATLEFVQQGVLLRMRVCLRLWIRRGDCCIWRYRLHSCIKQ